MALDLELDASQAAVAATFDRFFAAECPTSVVRAAEPLGHHPGLWERLAALGAPGLGVPAARGGGGASMSDRVLVAIAAGRVVAPVPLVDHLVAASCCGAADVESGRLAEVVSGASIAAFAPRPALDGVWSLVPAGAVASVVVGLDGDDLIAVWNDPPGRAPANHGDMPLADRSVTGERVVVGGRDDFDRLLAECRLLMAAQLSGLAERALEIVTAYVVDRAQFGRPIGGFQAVQHGLADCVPLVDGARLLCAKAAWAADTGRHGNVDVDRGEFDDAGVLSTMAFVAAAEAASAVTARAVQYHGSYGVSREFDIQLYHRRARGWPLSLGDPAAQVAELADRLWPRED